MTLNRKCRFQEVVSFVSVVRSYYWSRNNRTSDGPTQGVQADSK
jgi:hypothetical protein